MDTLSDPWVVGVGAVVAVVSVVMLRHLIGSVLYLRMESVPIAPRALVGAACCA